MFVTVFDDHRVSAEVVDVDERSSSRVCQSTRSADVDAQWLLDEVPKYEIVSLGETALGAVRR